MTVSTTDPATLARARERVQAASRVVVITGAGISAPSGIPTYRSTGSGWDDAKRERMSHASRYGNHLPELWEFWGMLRTITLSAEPNPAHLALAQWQQTLRARGGELLVATQNVDALHERAGTEDVVQLHGSMHRSRCLRCRQSFADSSAPPKGVVPRCECGGKLRPDVVLFGEQLRRANVTLVENALRRADVCLYVGTSGEVWPVSDFVAVAKAGRAYCLLANAEPWDHPHPDFDDTLLGSADVLLPQLLA